MRPFRSGYMGRGDGIDNYLTNLGLWRKAIPADDTAIYRVVAEQLFETQALHERVRRVCDSYVKRHADRLKKEWNGNGPLEFRAMAQLFKCDFWLYENGSRAPFNLTGLGHKKQVLVCMTSSNHYDSVHRRTFMENAAMSQSILYELLYERVFGVNNAVAMGQEMIGTKPLYPLNYRPPAPFSPTGLRPFFQNGEGYMACIGDQMNQTPLYRFTPFPYKVAKSLSPDIYRNVEYDAWKDAQKNSGFKLGDKCQIKSEDGSERLLNGHIQDVTVEGDSAVVFIIELGERHVVKLDKLIALPQLNSLDPAWKRRNRKKNCDCARACFNESCVGSQVIRNGVGSFGSGFRVLHRTRINSAGHPLKSSPSDGAAPADQMQMPADRMRLLIKVLELLYTITHSVNWTGMCGSYAGVMQNKVKSPVKTTFAPRTRFSCQRYSSEGHNDAFESQVDLNNNSAPSSAGYQKTERCVSTNEWSSELDVDNSLLVNSDHNGNGVFSQVVTQGDPFFSPGAVITGGLDYATGLSGFGSSSSAYTAMDMTAGAAGQADLQQLYMPQPSVCYMTAVPVQSVVIPMSDSVAGPINASVALSMDANGQDLPVNDPSTMRYFFNLGIQYFRMTSPIFSPPTSAVIQPSQHSVPCFTYPPTGSTPLCVTSLPPTPAPTGGAVIPIYEEPYAGPAPTLDDDFIVGSMACSPVSAMGASNGAAAAATGAYYYTSPTAVTSPTPYLSYPTLIQNM